MKKILPDCLVILLFAVIATAYFFPAVQEGRILFQHDTAAGAGAGQEIKAYYEQTGERSRWTDALFGGMPTYQISPSYDTDGPLRFVEKLYHLFLPNYIWYAFIMMLGFYILLRAFGISVCLSAIGGILWCFSSYFSILIAAGHLWKYITLAYIPPTIAGIVWAYRGRWWGALVATVFFALQILSNHLQMTYYFLFVILFLVIAFGVDAYYKGQMTKFWRATGILLVAAWIGVAMNLPNLYHTYTYSRHTMRGDNELTSGRTSVSEDGLEKTYITQWSYGIGETVSLLIPNVKGGASVPLSANKDAMKKADPRYVSIYGQLGQYFGEQPGTSGPVYVGAFVLLLFIFGAFIVKGAIKWALLGATLLSILLSWGHNFMPLTDLFIDYVPMYNKFRAVSSILVIAEFTIPLLAILALKEILVHPAVLKEKKALWISFGLTGGLALILAMMPSVFFPNYIPDTEMAMLKQGLPASEFAPFVENLTEIRRSIFTADAWRSFWIVAVGMVILLVYSHKKLKANWALAAIGILCLVDLWNVDKRYLNDGLFQTKRITTETFQQTEADKVILQDKDPNYRVLKLATNTFNENNTSYWHKSIGGYHAAKLLRYQQLIEWYITPEMQTLSRAIQANQGDLSKAGADEFPILNMLNMKYVIVPTQNGDVPILNPQAYGNAWRVNEVRYVADADEEIAGLGEVNPRETAVVDKRFQNLLSGMEKCPADTVATIRLNSYAPNRIVYESNATRDGIVVFSEIYYPEWTATIDDQPADVVCADYVLRAMHIPAGKHTIEMIFRPASIRATQAIAYIGWGVLLLGLLVALFGWRKHARLKDTVENLK